ncbi:MAG: ABC transporter substrate-binding protein [Candidatus Eisenbacteria bacterium]|uniref:ABC transporter substrate-binding protein n=1 Tax=Eiseniibacteriota bacterium TaxID=2212470 RepID=A0A948RYR0_UNCEI|nr:ABC transporter substrate-binding protein [Candidatus Eisenbacteria bacterium]MBU1949845.1 ABC transporter substrate-binding protein [Candidatus Eisenbacteria bacterium]MBU2693300.1 ABC transporter substrate-binding protein [Candidatus Eisenbacteria bacterium]
MIARAAVQCLFLLMLAILWPNTINTARAGENPDEAGQAATGKIKTFVDDLGDTLRWETRPQRIVSLSPNITELLFALGVSGETAGSSSRSGSSLGPLPGDQKIVGVTRFCDEPPEALTIYNVGGIVDPSLEAILSAEPDLVFVTRGNPRTFIESLRQLNIPLYAMDPNGPLQDLVEAMKRVGYAAGRAGEADALAADLKARLAVLEKRFGALPQEKKPRVYYGSIEPPLWTAGPGSTIDDIIRIAGGANIADDAPTPWCIYTLESVIAQNPQILLGVYPAGQKDAERRRIMHLLAESPGWKDTELGMIQQVCLIEENVLMRPGPRIVLAAENAARCFHPAEFSRDKTNPNGGH